MLRLCKNRVQQRVKNSDKLVNVSTKSTEQFNAFGFVPQKNTGLHNFATQYSTIKSVNLTVVAVSYSTVSTEPITTTTII